jgi:hypothetical protein
MALDYGPDIWRTAMQTIQECGRETDAKAYAFGMAGDCHAKGDMPGAERWARVATAIELALGVGTDLT